MLAALALCVALGSPVAAATPPAAASASGGARAVALAVVEIVEPVTNDPRGKTTLRVLSQTRDGRAFVEFQ